MVSTMLALLKPVNWKMLRSRMLSLFGIELVNSLNSLSLCLRYPVSSCHFPLFGVINCLFFCLFFCAQDCLAEFAIHYAEIQLQEEVYVLDADLDYPLTGAVIEALHNGIAVTLVVAISIERERWYLWNETVADLKQRYQLKYHALIQQYLVKYLNTGIEETFPTLTSAVMSLGKLRGLPLLDRHLIDPQSTYRVSLKNYLDIESLPVPLRPMAYFSSQWRLSSNWYICSCPLFSPLSAKN